MSSITEAPIFSNPNTLAEAVAVCSAEGGLSFIEHLRAKALNPCSCQPYLWCVGTDNIARVCLITRPACKRWSCPECAARNARRWIARIINGVNHLDGDWFMFTVTAHERQRGEYSVQNLRQGWKKLYDRARRKFETSQYVKVWELHHDGETFHLHGMVDTDWGERWLKDNSRECGMGYQTEIHNVDNAGQVAGYIAKYFLKSEGVLKDYPDAWPKHLHRIQVSQAWPKLPEIADLSRFNWTVLHTEDGADMWSEHKRMAGYRVIDLRR